METKVNLINASLSSTVQSKAPADGRKLNKKVKKY